MYSTKLSDLTAYNLYYYLNENKDTHCALCILIWFYLHDQLINLKDINTTHVLAMWRLSLMAGLVLLDGRGGHGEVNACEEQAC